ncbi:MAG: NAD(P)-dependent alcohol dehydrogenase [Zavarzinella sp.]
MKTTAAWHFSNPEQLIELVEIPVTENLPPDAVRLAVRATSLNYRDLINARQLANRNFSGVIPLSDGAGEIIEVGSEVTDFAIGDRVAGCFFQTWLSGPFQMAHHKAALGGSAPGMLAKEVVLPATGVVKIPDYLSFAEAACLPCAALTAFNALFQNTEQQALTGQTVLLQGTGGVSIFGLQMAVAAGAKTIITSSSDEKLNFARKFGAHHGINYQQTPDWGAEVLTITHQSGVQHILEVGGPGTLEKSLQAISTGGRISLIGVLTGFGAPTCSLFPLVSKNACLQGIYVGSREQFVRMNQFLTQHQIRPVIDRTFNFQDAREALNYLASGQHVGKVVVHHE